MEAPNPPCAGEAGSRGSVFLQGSELDFDLRFSYHAEMRLWMRILIWFGSLVVGASATSVEPRDFQCPLCGKPFVDTVLMSYNSFGYRPPRDEIFRPPYAARSGIRICPHDLYASWDYRWDKLKPDEKERLVGLLKQAAVVLTEEEKKIAVSDSDRLRESPWWNIWWSRTCDQMREPDAAHQSSTILALYHAGDLQSQEPWIRELSAHYRELAIKQLAGAESRSERYLRAELMRQSGKTDESLAAFRKLVDDLSKPAENEDEETKEERLDVRAICEEGIYLSEASQMPAGKIAAWLIPDFPMPDRRGKPPANWSRHRIAVQTLVERAISGDRESQDQLWKSVSRDPKRLLAIHLTLKETPDAPESCLLIDCGGEWADWLGQLAADAANSKLLVGGREDADADQYLNLFQSFDFSGIDVNDPQWRTKILLPQVIKAEAEAKFIEPELSSDDPGFDLGELADEVPGNVTAVRYAIIRFLMQQPEPGKKVPRYGIRHALVSLAEASAKPGARPIPVEGNWKGAWWKLATGYAVGNQELGPKLAAHPLVSGSFEGDGKAFENLTYELFGARKDPIWKEKILKVLDTAPWLPDEPTDYALSLEDKSVNEALQRRVARLRKKEIPESHEILSFYEIQRTESHERGRKMDALPIR